MVDESVSGTYQPGYEMEVERGKIREFARATMSRNPDYLDDPVAVIPPTFLMSSGFWAPPGSPAPAAALNMNLARTLHGGQEFVFYGPPPRAGAKLTTTSRVDKVYEKEGRRGGTMRFAEAVTEFRDEGGKLVAESRTTVIETGKAATAEGS
jgi:N-terminal half of MaoC dehydratase